MTAHEHPEASAPALFSDEEIAAWSGSAAERLDSWDHDHCLSSARAIVANWLTVAACTTDRATTNLEGSNEGAVRTDAIALLEWSQRQVGYRSIVKSLRPIDLLTEYANAAARDINRRIADQYAQDVIYRDAKELSTLHNCLRSIYGGVHLAAEAIGWAMLEGDAASTDDSG